MKTVWTWLEGKKTYIGAIALVLVAAAGYWFGLVNDVQLGAAVAIALGIFGQRQYAERATAMLIEEINKAKQQKSLPGGPTGHQSQPGA